MKIRSISTEDADKLCCRPEDHFFDRKALQVSGAKIQKIAVGLANSDGGEFIVGVADDKEEADSTRRWNGADVPEAFNGHLQALYEVQPAVPAVYRFLESPDYHGFVLHVTVEKSSEVHRTADGTVYQRVGAQCLPIRDAQRILELSLAKGAASYEDKVVESVTPETVVETDAVKWFLNEYSPRTDPLDFVVSQNLVDQNNWTPRVAAILLFADNPSAYMPKKCAVKIARYETREDEPERDHLKTQLTIEAPLYRLIHEAVSAVTDIMSSISIWTTEGLRTVQYPPEAIWEIVVNALIHRDYSISDDVHIYIYDNRIEVLSPGRLPGFVTVKTILDSRYSRNHKIVRTLSRYPNPPNKDLGEGLNTAFQKMKEWRLKDPEIYEEGNYVKVVLPHVPLASPSDAILDFLAHNESVTNRQARDITGIRSENLVKIEFYKLRDAGLIERIPGLNGPASAWRLKDSNTGNVASMQNELPL